jgi:undecaprenyl-phosphate galactose phosphotransferase
VDLSLQPATSAPFQRVIKRILDLCGATAGLLLFGPVFLLIGALIRLETPGGVFYRQERVGKEGQPFTLLKFRTMQAGAEAELVQILATNVDCRTDYQHYQKLAHDPRLTNFGRFLRKTSLDELPQLWNVLKGEMSLVGPRPFLPEQLHLYGPAYNYYQGALPGLTGLWQVSGRNRLSFDERARLDEVYCREWSLWLDLKILLVTPWAVLRQDGAF